MNHPLFQDKVAEIFVAVDDFCKEFEDEFKNINSHPVQQLKLATEKLHLVIAKSSLY